LVYLLNTGYKALFFLASQFWALLILALVTATIWWFFIRKGHKNDK
jgi:hypothetical protein